MASAVLNTTPRKKRKNETKTRRKERFRNASTRRASDTAPSRAGTGGADPPKRQVPRTDATPETAMIRPDTRPRPA
jgi:hypothetical protein